jgi:sortase B
MIILVISSYFLIKNFLEYKTSNNSNKELIEDVFIEENNDEKDNTINWDKMLEINKDIIGWIRIENTNINYPILKDNDNLKYLKHSYNGNYNSNGSIFTLNNDPFNEKITTIYGHNMKNGIMFSELSKYMNEEFLKEHSNIEIYTKAQNYKATIFSCYSIDVNQEEINIKLLDFEDEIEYYKKASKYSIDNIGEIKKIIKLSTCSYLNNHTTPTTQRYYIVANLEKIN